MHHCLLSSDPPPQARPKQYNKLIHQDAAPVIFGPTTSGQAEAQVPTLSLSLPYRQKSPGFDARSPIAQQNEVVAFSSSSNASGLSALGNFLFRAGLTLNSSRVRR